MRKLSFEENLRHRLRDLPRGRYRGERSSTGEGLVFLAIGAAVGIAAGVVIAQKFGGFSALADKLRDRLGNGEEEFPAEEYDEYEEEDEDSFEDIELSPLEELEQRVLEAYHNDPILSERAIDIGAIDEGIIELTGWVYAASEADHAVTIAGGTPGVETVLNRLAIRAEEDKLGDSAVRYEAGDDRLTESHWEGQGVGMGRRRQTRAAGSGAGPDADVKAELGDVWQNEEEARLAAANPLETPAGRAKRPPSSAARAGERTVNPKAATKADDVASSEEPPPSA